MDYTLHIVLASEELGIAEGLRHIGVPVLHGAATTAIGTGLFSLGSARPFQSFSIISPSVCGFGVLFGALVMPACLHLLGLDSPVHGDSKRAAALEERRHSVVDAESSRSAIPAETRGSVDVVTQS